MSEIFNLFIKTSYFPHYLKYFITKPIYKNNSLSMEDLNNYRPILLISNISNIFVKCIYSRIINFLEKNKFG